MACVRDVITLDGPAASGKSSVASKTWWMPSSETAVRCWTPLGAAVKAR